MAIIVAQADLTEVCAQADFPNVEVEEIDMTTPKGRELVQKYGIMSSSGIVINDELFSTGGVDKNKLVEKLKSLK